MKRFVFVATLVTWHCWVPTASAQYVWQYVTREQAIQKVREIVGDDAAPVEVQYIAPPSLRLGVEALHRLRCNNREFSICAFNINHWRWTWYYFLDESFYDEPFSEEMLRRRATLSEQEAVAIASSYMQTHYPLPELLNHIEVRSGGGIGRIPAEYTVYFWQRLPNGVYGPSWCRVDVDRVYGRVTGAGCVYYPLLVSTIPVLTPEQAFAAAAQQLGLVNAEAGVVDRLFVMYPDPFGWQTLVYRLTVYGDRPGHVWLGYGCAVDAFTGTLLGWSTLQGSTQQKEKPIRNTAAPRERPVKVDWDGRPVHLNRPALDIGGDAYFWVGYLMAGGERGGLRWYRNGECIVVTRRGEVRLQARQSRYSIVGRQMQASKAPQLIRGRLYVPIEMMRQVLGADIRYDRAKQCVFVRTRK